ncbi:MBL fold metallo-hydrolase [Pseudarthrobacter siccitolerans]
MVEIAMRRPLDIVLSNCRESHWKDLEWLRPQFLDENDEGIFAVHSYVLEVAGRVIVVDTGFGNDKVRKAYRTGNQLSTQFLERMTDAGAEPERVDTVLSTHLHVDHVGWNTILVDGEWTPTFPHARYLMDRAEVDYWSTVTGELGTVEGDQVQVFEDSISPILRAGLVDYVMGDHEVAPGVDIVAARGHTPGHGCVRIRSGGAEAWILGDAAHHPVQVAHPALAAKGDLDLDDARKERERLWRTFTDQPILVFGSHWPGEAVRIVSDGASRRVVQVPG